MLTAVKQNTLTNKPMIIAGITLTKPAAGVIATNPATAPEQTPNIVGFPLRIHSIIAQLKPAAAAAVLVTTKAFTAKPFAARALPALNPNQPHQRKPVPSTPKGKLCGAGPLWSKFFLLPINKAVTMAAIPALTCTTVP